MMKPSVSVSLDWRFGSARLIEKLPSDAKYRTCCNCCHIKTGTVFLGLVELVSVAFLLVSIVKQLLWKHDDRSLCAPGELWKDCLIFDFSHFNVTLVGDYVIALLMISIMFSVVLLFYGIISVSPGFLMPHIIVQFFGLIFSLGYFGLYAWSYFYGDLHTQEKAFEFEPFVERMWLATILLIFSAFQIYLFFTVIKCALYLSTLNGEQKRRKQQFEEVSNRVRLAKENGLWRHTSWGGGIEQYKGQYEDEEKRKERRKNRPANRVQWDLQKNEEKSISCCPEDNSYELEERRVPEPMEPVILKEPKKPAIKRTRSQEGEQNLPGPPSSNAPGKSSESRDRDRHHHKRQHSRTAPDGSHGSPNRLHKTDSSDSRRHKHESGNSPTTKKKRPKEGGASGAPTDSPKASHRSRREHHHRSSGGEEKEREVAGGTGRTSPTKAIMSTSASSSTTAGGPLVKKVSISSTNPPTFHPGSSIVS